MNIYFLFLLFCVYSLQFTSKNIYIYACGYSRAEHVFVLYMCTREHTHVVVRYHFLLAETRLNYLLNMTYHGDSYNLD